MFFDTIPYVNRIRACIINKELNNYLNKFQKSILHFNPISNTNSTLFMTKNRFLEMHPMKLMYNY